MSTTSPSKEKYCSILSELIDKSKNIITDTEDPLEYDAVELTLLLKSIGFRLISFEFDQSPKQDSNDIEIEIRCQQSGMASKLILSSNKCTCPNRKTANNNSFWEIQGFAPSTPKNNLQNQIIQDTSCNLLPEITKKTSNVARAILTVLLQQYQYQNQSDFGQKQEKLKQVDVKQVLERLNNKNLLIEKSLELKNSMSPDDKNSNDTNSHCSTPLSSINVTPVPSYDGPIINLCPKIILHDQNQNETNEENENDTKIKFIDKTENMSNEFPEPQNLGSTKSEPNLIDLTENKEVSLEQLNADNERDICLIQAIEEARKKLDSALLMLKCNITRDLSQSSILTVTPQNLKFPIKPADANISIKKFQIKKLAPPNLDVNRRHSTGNRVEPNPSSSNKGFLKPLGSVIDNRRKTGNIPSKFLKPDTPRPWAGVGDVKKTEPSTKYVIKRTSTGTILKSGVGKTPITKNVGKITSGVGSNKK